MSAADLARQQTRFEGKTDLLPQAEPVVLEPSSNQLLGAVRLDHDVEPPERTEVLGG
jgi:hypothetical protein